MKLVAGVVMVALAVSMAIDPTWLSRMSGTVLVFGSAGAVALAIALVDKHLRSSVTDSHGLATRNRSGSPG